MQIDSFFSIGNSHNVCEDYALHGVVNERPFAVLSDGCSSSKYTDFGSRFLCLATQEAMKVSLPEGFARGSVLPYACSLVGTILPWECLDATLVVLHSSEGLLTSEMVGDGVVVARRRNGLFHVRKVEFSNNAPGYLTYQLDRGRYAAFKEGREGGESGGIRTITETWWDSDFEKQIDESSVYTEEVKEENLFTFWDQIFYDRGTFDLVVAFSDGVLSFQRKTALGNLENVSLRDVLRQLMAFKGMKGEFVKRRCRKFLRKFCIEKQWSHYDDFSMIAMYDDSEV